MIRLKWDSNEQECRLETQTAIGLFTVEEISMLDGTWRAMLGDKLIQSGFLVDCLIACERLVSEGAL